MRTQTIGASFAMKKVEVAGRQCNLGIWVRPPFPPWASQARSIRFPGSRITGASGRLRRSHGPVSPPPPPPNPIASPPLTILCDTGRHPPTPMVPSPHAFLARRAQDTAGQERFDSLSSFYCRGARAAIICFDLTDRYAASQRPPRRWPDPRGCSEACSRLSGQSPCAWSLRALVGSDAPTPPLAALPSSAFRTSGSRR